MRALVLALLLVACGGEAEPAPLACTSSVDADRLVVVCNAPVSPVPEWCELEAPSTYRCNWLHASAEQCAAFPGICQ